MTNDEVHQKPKQPEEPGESVEPREPEQSDVSGFVPNPTKRALAFRDGDCMSDDALMGWASYVASKD
jgi:hypothetical protein